jgi:formate dehydrogenase iron-sulfur subunit
MNAPAPTAARLFLPRDAAAVALGADRVASVLAEALAAAGRPAALVRNGTRGMLWLEPMLEVDTPAGRIAFGPLEPADVVTLLGAGLLDAHASPQLPPALGVHPRYLGPTANIPYFARQQRVTFARVGVTDPLSLADYEAHGGWRGLDRALSMTPTAVVGEVAESGLRGRGGAAFPAGIKWRTVAAAPGAHKAIVCNADEGDSGTFSDRMLMEGDPYALVEGMAIAGLAVGATRGWVYVRSEYPHAEAALREAVARATAAGILGASLRGRGPAFEMEIRRGAGSYVCGEETALLESVEGKRGIVRAKPPLPAHQGLFGWPTVINNVITLASVPAILADGAAAYHAAGVGRSRGTLPFQLAGNIRFGGLVELPLGVTLRHLVEDFGGGTASGRPIKAIQVGGPLGAYIAPAEWDRPLDYEAYLAIGATVGHGGIVVHDDTADVASLARYAMEFCALESCGKCTPCRIGSTRGVEVIDRLVAAPAEAKVAQVTLLRDLCQTMTLGSLCAMGGMTPFPVLSALDHYPEDFGLAAPAAAVGEK